MSVKVNTFFLFKHILSIICRFMLGMIWFLFFALVNVACSKFYLVETKGKNSLFKFFKRVEITPHII